MISHRRMVGRMCGLVDPVEVDSLAKAPGLWKQFMDSVLEAKRLAAGAGARTLVVFFDSPLPGRVRLETVHFGVVLREGTLSAPFVLAEVMRYVPLATLEHQIAYSGGFKWAVLRAVDGVYGLKARLYAEDTAPVSESVTEFVWHQTRSVTDDPLQNSPLVAHENEFSPQAAFPAPLCQSSAA